MSQYNAAEAQIQFKEAVTGVSKEFAELTEALEQAEEKTEGMEARVSAIDRLVRDGLLTQAPFDPSGADDDVEGQLAALRRDIAQP